MADEKDPSYWDRAKEVWDKLYNVREHMNRDTFNYAVSKGMDVDQALAAVNRLNSKMDRSNIIYGGASNLIGGAQLADLGYGLASEYANRASGGRLLQDEYPTHYMPHVGRQVMGGGGSPDDVVDQAMQIVPQQNNAPALARSIVQKASEPKQEEQIYPVDEQHRTVMDANKGKGLQFPENDGLNRLRLVAARRQKEAEGQKVPGYPANERTVIRAPKDERNLPDFVVGHINFDDWKKRHETLLSNDEILKASKWYDDVYGQFARYSNNPADIKRNMRAWLVANQNATPEESQKNAILQAEQIRRGVPEEQMLKGGLESPTFAARAVIRNKPIEGGVGQKIADFVDSAEGKDVRSWMANHPHGGAPFVVDVHTARDTGMVDDTILNHLRRLGYNEDDLKNIKVDLKGPPTEAAYENRAAFGRALTDHLNQIKWQGKDDWTPAQVQAVGWMGMTKLTANKEPTAESGLAKNYRRISFEASPGAGSPWDRKYGAQFAALDPQDARQITYDLTKKAMDAVAPLAGIDVHRLVHGTGGWKDKDYTATNPAAVAQGQIHKTGGDIAANALGYLLNQTEVWHNIIKPMTKNPKAFAVDFVEKGSKTLSDPQKIDEFWENLVKADPTGLFGGFQPIETPSGEVGIRVLIPQGGKKNAERIMNALQGKVEEGSAKKGGNSLHQYIAKLPFDMHATPYEAEITQHRNDWKENPNGEAYLQRLGDILGPSATTTINSIREKLEKEVEGHFARIAQRQKRPQEEIKRASGGQVEENPYDDTIGATGEYPQTHAETGELPVGRGISGGQSPFHSHDQGGDQTPLEGLPTTVKIPATGEYITAGPDANIRKVAREYMEEAGLPYNPPKKYKRVNPKEAERFAQAFEEMKHDPEHPLVKASYAQMIKEVGDQYNAAKRAGAQFEFWDPNTQENPYAASPRLATEDLRKNNHMYVFPTHAGYGDRSITEEDIRQNPLLADSGERWNGMPVTYNDLFRAIHDYYGHAKEGLGFRHDGEENAWRAHAAMFSPLARIAMTSETRGQNSWLNFGPHGEKNRTAKEDETIFADQKIGALPLWVLHHEAEDMVHPEDIKALKQIYAQHGMDTEHLAPHQKKIGGQVTKNKNLEIFLKDNHPDVPEKLIHVTGDDIHSFSPEHGIAAWAAGPEFADKFARSKYLYWKSQLQPWERQPAPPNHGDKPWLNYMPVHIKASNPFDARNLIPDLSDDLKDIKQIEPTAKTLGLNAQDIFNAIPKTMINAKGGQSDRKLLAADILRNSLVTNKLREMGHDSLIAHEFDHPVFAVFEPNQVKSATGNQGSFDPNNPDITKSEGGNVN